MSVNIIICHLPRSWRKWQKRVPVFAIKTPQRETKSKLFQNKNSQNYELYEYKLWQKRSRNKPKVGKIIFKTMKSSITFGKYLFVYYFIY